MKKRFFSHRWTNERKWMIPYEKRCQLRILKWQKSPRHKDQIQIEANALEVFWLYHCVPSKSRRIRKLFEIIIPCWFSKMLVCLKNQLMHEYGRLCSTLCSRLCLSASDDLVHMRWCTTNAWVCTWGNSRAISVFLINYYWLLLFLLNH